MRQISSEKLPSLKRWMDIFIKMIKKFSFRRNSPPTHLRIPWHNDTLMIFFLPFLCFFLVERWKKLCPLFLDGSFRRKIFSHLPKNVSENFFTIFVLLKLQKLVLPTNAVFRPHSPTPSERGFWSRFPRFFQRDTTARFIFHLWEITL